MVLKPLALFCGIQWDSTDAIFYKLRYYFLSCPVHGWPIIHERRWTDKSVPPLCYFTKQMSNLPLVLQREFDSMRIAFPATEFFLFPPPHMLGCGLFPFRAWLTWVR